MHPPSPRARLRRIYRALLQRLGPQGWWPARSRVEVLVGALLTQNTAWKNVEKAIVELRRRRLLTLRALAALPRPLLARAIRSSGYYNMKARYLKGLARHIVTRYGGNLRAMFRRDLAALREELLTLPGIGEETADSILLYAGDHPVFVVDAYTKRILSRHGLLHTHATYGDTQHLLTAALPRDATLYNEYHALLVRVGKEYCRAVPRCEICPLHFDLPRASAETIRNQGKGSGVPVRGGGQGLSEEHRNERRSRSRR